MTNTDVATQVVGDSSSQPPAPPRNSAGRYAHIDALRAVAVMLVVVAHAGLGGIVPGGSGVTVFFAISGFIITFLLLKEHGETGSFSPGGFYRRRAFKIAPPFLLLILIPTFIYATFKPIDWSNVASQTFFYYNWVKLEDGGGVVPGSPVVWSLAIEEQFYVLIALLWIFVSRRPLAVRTLAIVALAIIAISTSLRFLLPYIGDFSTATVEGGSNSRIYYGSDTRADGIAWGMLGACFYYAVVTSPNAFARLQKLVASNGALVVAIGLYLASLAIRDAFFRDTLRYSLQSVSATILILFGLLATSQRGKVLTDWAATLPGVQLVGLASYSIYLAHFGVAKLIEWQIPNMNLPTQVVLVTAGGVAVGVAVYRYVEVPVAAWQRRRVARSAEAGT